MKTVKEFEEKLIKENPEVWDHIRQLRRKKMIKVILLCALVIFGSVMTMPSMKTLYMKICTCVFCVIVCFLIGVFTKPGKVFWGKKRFGVIEEIKVASHLSSVTSKGYYGRPITSSRAVTTSMKTGVFLDLIVRFEGEETRKKGRVLSIPRKYENCFKKGDRIVQYQPLSYPVLVENTSERKHRLCHRCHALMKNGERECQHCHAKLILFEDTFFEDWYIT